MSKIVRCVLLDDELLGLQYLKMLCGQIANVEVVKAYNHPEKFLNDLPQLSFDLCILDIEMPGMSGLQVANLLSDKLVVFTTAYTEYAVEAFEINALDYLTKPVKKERLQRAVEKALLYMNKTQDAKDYITVNTDRGKALLQFQNIAYVTVSEVDSRDKLVYLHDGTYWVLKNISFEKLLASLPEQTFCRVNKKEIISMEIVHFYSHDEIESSILIQNKPKMFTIGTHYRQEFLSKL